MQSERFPVIGGKHPLDVRFLVENLSAQLVVGYHPCVAVVLQGTAAHFQLCRHLPVRQEAFTAQSRTAVCHKVLNAVHQTVKRIAELGDQRMALGNHFAHSYIGFSGTIKSDGSVCPFAFYGFDDTHHVLRLVTPLSEKSILPLSILFLLLILGFACKVKGYRASNNGLAVSWKYLAALGVFSK